MKVTCWKCHKKYKFMGGRAICFNIVTSGRNPIISNPRVNKYYKYKYGQIELPQPLCSKCIERFRQFLGEQWWKEV